MGLFEWIGEAIGGAFRALAEFIGDVLGGIIGGLGKDVSGMVNDMYADASISAKDPTTQPHKSAADFQKLTTEPITKGFDHTVKELADHHSELTPEQAATEVTQLWDKVRNDTGIATVAGIAVEAASLGQIEGAMVAFNVADRVSAATEFAHQVKMMQFTAQWFRAYERFLNMQNPTAIAGPSDIVRFALREVWDPTRRSELIREDAPGDYYNYMLQHGFPQTRAQDYWAAHWVLPDVYSLNEMLHRGVIDDLTWDRFVKYNDYDPEVRPWLKAISYNPYTRVDSQRMWTLDLLTEAELKQNYKDLGYDDEHAQRMTLWTKITTLATELRARYSKGWITSQNVKDELLAEGMPPESIERWVQRIVKAEKEERTTTERDLTKSEIIKGYKNGLIDYPTAVAMLMDMGYDSDEAEYIIVVNTEAGAGSPETFSEFQNMVNLRRKSQGLPIRPIPDEIKTLEQQIQRYEKVREQAKEDGQDEEFYKELDKHVNPLKRRLRSLIQTYQKR